MESGVNGTDLVAPWVLAQATEMCGFPKQRSLVMRLPGSSAVQVGVAHGAIGDA